MEKKKLNKKKVCIVEDDPSIREIYSLALEKSGFEVSLASDGEEGYEVIRRELPDVALIDIVMPKKNGIELMEMLQNDKDLLKIPVIVLTNVEDEKMLKKAGELRSKFYLVKSLFTPQKVVEITREVLASRREGV
jgi:two-component system, chemotaxis family, sensor histidine kinase and response regulator WspE